MSTEIEINNQRRFDIDWLRSLAFILLIFYHIGMFYVADWGWHVKSAYQSEFLQNIMMLVNQWRMPLIFLISGIALALVEPKINRSQLLKTRFMRVFVPLVIGMYLIVPPQLYFELIQKEGFNDSYLTFLNFYIDPDTSFYPQHQHGALGLLTWNHLWYLAYLWHYTLIYCLLKPLLVKIEWQQLTVNSRARWIFLVPVFILFFYGVALKPYFPKTNALTDDWYNHAIYFSVFLMGYALAKSPSMWQKIIHKRQSWLVLAIVSFFLIMALIHDWIDVLLIWAGADMAFVDQFWPVQLLVQLVVYANVVSWLFVVLGFAGAHLNKKSAALSYLNEAVLPWYILHQTVTVAAGMYLADYALGGVIEPLLLVLLTFLICFVGYELIRRNNLTRFIFGMKMIKAKNKLEHNLAQKPLNLA